jgi:hypothetical protein
MKRKFILALALTMLAFTTHAADSATTDNATSEEMTKESASTKTESLSEVKNPQHFTFEEIKDVQASCHAEDIEKASQGDVLSYKKILSFQIQLSMSLDKLNQSNQLLASVQDKLRNSEALQYANWETIKSYYDSYATTRKIESLSRMQIKMLQQCLSRTEAVPELQKSLFDSILFFQNSIKPVSSQ